MTLRRGPVLLKNPDLQLTFIDGMVRESLAVAGNCDGGEPEGKKASAESHYMTAAVLPSSGRWMTTLR